METSSSFNVEDQINNCRLCFKPLTDQQKTVQITEMIEEKFLDLTQIQVKFWDFLLCFFIYFAISYFLALHRRRLLQTNLYRMWQRSQCLLKLPVNFKFSLFSKVFLFFFCFLDQTWLKSNNDCMKQNHTVLRNHWWSMNLKNHPTW